MRVLGDTKWVQVMNVVLMLTIACTPLCAQTGTSTITGTVTDASGGALPGVDITLTNPETGAKLATISNETGVYRYGSLPPGNYRVEAALPGFAPLSRGPLTLQAVSYTHLRAHET